MCCIKCVPNVIYCIHCSNTNLQICTYDSSNYPISEQLIQSTINVEIKIEMMYVCASITHSPISTKCIRNLINVDIIDTTTQFSIQLLSPLLFSIHKLLLTIAKSLSDCYTVIIIIYIVAIAFFELYIHIRYHGIMHISHPPMCITSSVKFVFMPIGFRSIQINF